MRQTLGMSMSMLVSFNDVTQPRITWDESLNE